MDKGADKVRDILLLSNFVVNGKRPCGQGIKDNLDVKFRTTSNANVEILEVKANELIHKVKNFFSW
jgi:hypothetical protein